LDSIKATDRIQKALGSGTLDRVPQGVKNPVEKALTALVADKAITPSEKKEIEDLIDYRNAVGHTFANELMVYELLPVRLTPA
jgi:hypothetical protein